MKVRIKNNRLVLEGKVQNLNDASYERLKEIAAKYQIGSQRFTFREVEVINKGRSVMRTEEVVEPKTHSQLADEIRKKLTVGIIIPREYWTEEQREAFNSNDLLNEKDISREIAVKKAAGIQIDLVPFEEVKDTIKKASMLAEVTESQWDFLKKEFNKTIKRIKDEDGRLIGKKENYRHILMVEEYVPENDEDVKRLEEEEKKKEAKSGKSK